MPDSLANTVQPLDWIRLSVYGRKGSICANQSLRARRDAKQSSELLTAFDDVPPDV